MGFLRHACPSSLRPFEGALLLKGFRHSREVAFSALSQIVGVCIGPKIGVDEVLVDVDPLQRVELLVGLRILLLPEALDVLQGRLGCSVGDGSHVL